MGLCSGVVDAQEPPGIRPGHGQVVWVQDGGAVELYRPYPQAVRGMVDAVVTGVAGRSQIAAAWRQFVSPGDRIGIKVSASAHPVMNTRREVVHAIIEGLQEAGISRKNIVIFDRNRSDLTAAGFTAETMGCRVLASEELWDEDAIFSAPALGRLIIGDLLFKPSAAGFGPGGGDTDAFSSRSHFSKVVSREVDKIINVPVMAESRFSGIAGALYNVTVPNVDNWRRFTGRPGFGDPAITELLLDEFLANKVVLHILDALVAQYAAWPDFAAHYSITHGAIYASRDPVALDAISLPLLEEWRIEGNLPPIGNRARHVITAGRAGLGEADAEKVALRQVWRR